MGSQNAASDSDFNVLQFEKTLNTLKDSQDSINSCCQWCLQNRQHHKKIVNSWLNVLKRVKVEQRLILFYLANDVVQYSKRKNYEYVESWGTALQKATTMVRDERVKHKILRIFKIWEQRGVYGEEFIADLCGLINVTPTGVKNDEPHEFQATYVVNKIKTCANLEKDTDAKLKVFKEHNPKIQLTENLITSLKDRAHVDDVEKEVDIYVKHMDNYINALKAEIKSRIALISVLRQADSQLEADRKDVKLVAHAYKMFGQRVKTFQKKLEEHMATLPSPLPSPDINAPSPSPDSDLELPDDISPKKSTASDGQTSMDTSVHFTNAGYYNPVTNTITTSSHETSSGFVTNGFTSFIGTNMSFDVSSINSSSLFSNAFDNVSDITHTTNSYAPAPVVAPLPVEAPAPSAPYTPSHLPLAPPPMPPFTKAAAAAGAGYAINADGDTSGTGYGTAVTTYQSTTYNSDVYVPDNGVTVTQDSSRFSYQSQDTSMSYPATVSSDQYDPTDVPDDWEDEGNWNNIKDTDTPESPPMFEKEGYADPIEYHDGNVRRGATDIDQRILPGMGDIEDSLSSLGGKDVDHRNLISLTGSPAPPETVPPPPTTEVDIWKSRDQDYRHLMNPNPPPPEPAAPDNAVDKDYRLHFNLDLPPPPPPPPKSPGKTFQEAPPLPLQDMDIRNPPPPARVQGGRKESNVESIDMDLSDEDMEHRMFRHDGQNNRTHGGYEDNSRGNEEHFCLQPPPPLPDLLDDVDVDANQFLDELSNDISEFGNLSNELKRQKESAGEQNMWHLPPGMPPPNMPPPGMPPPGLPPPPGMMTQDGRQQRQDSMPPGPPMPPMNFIPPGPMLNQMDVPKGALLPTPTSIDGNHRHMIPLTMPPPPANWIPGADQQQAWMHQQPFSDESFGGDENHFRDFRGRGRGAFRGNGNWDRGRGRGGGGFRGGPRGRAGGGGGGGNRGPRGGSFRPRGNFRGNFRGGFS